MEENRVENVEKVETKKSNFVPSYARQKEEKGDNAKSSVKKNRVKKTKKLKSKISFLIILIAIILVITLLYFLVFRNLNIIKSNYDELMEDYGLVTLYNNQLSNGNETVTKAEAIKLVLATTLNTENIEDYLSSDVVEKYPNSKWVYYAKAIELISDTDITSENYNDTEEYKNVIRYFGGAKSKILGKTLDTTVDPEFKDFSTYTPDEKWAISDLAYNGIIENTKSDLNGNNKLTKSKLNRLVIEFALKYNLITVNGEKININKDKMPSNADEFPYTLATIDKSVYEMENYISNKENYKNARKTYVELKNSYKQIDGTIEDYFRVLINVDYENENIQENVKKLFNTTNYEFDEKKYTEYVNYAKENKIKMSGEVKVQHPIIYFDGTNYRTRVKVTINVESAINTKNLVLLDNDQEYKIGKNELYLDVPMKYSDINNMYYILPRSLKDMKSSKVHEEVIIEEKPEQTEEMKELEEFQKNLTEEELKNAIEV